MKLLYLECNMGIAGDMLMGALLELLPDKEAFIRQMNGMGLLDVHIDCEEAVKCGIVGTHVSVKIRGQEEESLDHREERVDNRKESLDHGEERVDLQKERLYRQGESKEHQGQHEDLHAAEHSRGQSHSHGALHADRHRGLEDIFQIIDGLSVPEKVRDDAKNIYKIIAEAEGQVHGEAVADIHFHEVGTMDAIADIVGCALLFDWLGADRVAASAVNTGYGQVKCAHGILPVPAPATARILQGIPCYAGEIRGELCTPTGAALLKYFVQDFTVLPRMTIEKIGYGMGKKDFPAANCVRAFWGQGNRSDRSVL